MRSVLFQSIGDFDADLSCLLVVAQECHTLEIFDQPIRASTLDSVNAVCGSKTQHCTPSCFTGPNARWRILDDEESAGGFTA